MLRTVNPQPTLWETLLPVECLALSSELAAVDGLLDDPRLFEPFRTHFSPTEGRPSVPIETYLRMMFLKARYGLGYERLCREVNDSLSWRRFCRLPLGELAPDPSTLMKITKRCGADVVDDLNALMLAKAVEDRLVKLDRVRVDTTVVEADIAYPTDSGLLTRAVCRLSKLVGRIQTVGAATRTTVVDRTTEARGYAHAIGAWLRRRSGDAKDEVLKITGDIADIAEATAVEAERVMVNGRRWLAAHPDCDKPGRLRAMLDDLDVLVGRTKTVVDQTRLRVDGEQPAGASRVVSLHEPDARPIRKGRLGRPVEFGYKTQIVDNVDGIVLDHSVHVGNPPDADLIGEAIGRVVERCGTAPDAVTADRGYGYARIDKALAGRGVATVVIPRSGKPGEARRDIEHADAFQELVRWRTGAEGRISCLKRDYGMRRTRLRRHVGARTWIGHGVLAHNLVKLARLRT